MNVCCKDLVFKMLHPFHSGRKAVFVSEIIAKAYMRHMLVSFYKEQEIFYVEKIFKCNIDLLLTRMSYKLIVTENSSFGYAMLSSNR